MKKLDKLNKYNEKVQKEIIETLKAYNECHVERHGDEFKVCVGWCLKSHYGDEEILDEFTVPFAGVVYGVLPLRLR